MKVTPLLLALTFLASSLQALYYEPVNAFRLGPEQPGSATLVRHPDGSDYGTTPEGGPQGEGTLYRITSTGAVELLAAFSFQRNPNPGGLTLDAAGSLWGVSPGVFDSGTVFRFDPSTRVLTTVVTFATGGALGAAPKAELFNDGAGFMWGTTTFGGTDDQGTIFKVNIVTGALTVVTSFTGTTGLAKGARPRARLVPDAAGHLWGTTEFGGAASEGTVFKLNRATGAFTTLVEFTGGATVAGSNPRAPLVADGQGFFWGTTPAGGSGDFGTAFKVGTSTGAFTSVFAFTGKSGTHPGQGSAAALVLEPAGTLLGVSPRIQNFNGTVEGSIYRITPSTGAVTALLQFTGRAGAAPGTDPLSTLTPVGSGIYRGTTFLGGTAGRGTVYQFNAAAATASTVANLLGTEPPPSGAVPVGKLVSDGLGFLWGVTEKNGLFGHGTIFKLNVASRAITTMVDFTGANGSAPVHELVLHAGFLWGVTPEGGPATGGGAGTVFKVNPATGAFTSIAGFEFNTGPQEPGGALLPDGAGALWGCATAGGTHDRGAIYKVDVATGAVSVAVSFRQDPDDAPAATPLGFKPTGALALATDGRIWGATLLGGMLGESTGGDLESGQGTVFKIDPVSNALTTVVQFTGSAGAAKGRNPNGSLVSDGAGSFLGTTTSATVFKVTIASGAYKVLATVGGPINPGLASDGAGKFWGTTRTGGTSLFGQGTAFRISPTGTVQTVLQFSDTPARVPNGGLLLHAGAFYGVTEQGGTTADGEGGGGGEIYRLVVDEPPVSAEVIAVKGAPVPGETDITCAGLGVPETGPFVGSLKVGTKTVPAIFAPDGTVRARVGGPAPGVSDAVFAKLGAPSGDTALATLKVNSLAGVFSKNDTVLLAGLIAGPVRIVAREGRDLDGHTGISIKSFGAIDGAPNAIAATFLRVTLQGFGVTSKSDSALLGIQAEGTVRVLVREGALVGDKAISIIATLVGVKGALAEARWRADDSSFGVRLTFSDKSQALYTIPVTATSPAQWTRWIGIGDSLAAPLVGALITKLGFPAFGSAGPSVLATFKSGVGGVTAKSDTAVVRIDSSGLVLLAREGSTPPGLASSVTFKTLTDPVAGADGRTAFAATISGVSAAFAKGIWYSADGETLTRIARTGGLAPRGGVFASFTSLALPDGPQRGPIFTGKLAPDKALDLTTANNTGLWAVNTEGDLSLVVRTGQKIVLAGTPRTIKSFTTLLPFVPSIGAAHSYDNAGNIAVVATFTDKTVALLKLLVP